MSIRLMTAVTKYGPKNSSHRFVLLMIADNAADDGSNAFPAVETLAEKTALSERTVIRALNSLVRDGWLRRQRRQNTSNIYQIVMEKLQSPVSDRLSPTVDDTVSLTDSVGDTVSLSDVTDCHLRKCQDVTYVSDTMSPDPSLLNHPINRQSNQGRGSGANAPAHPPAASPQFQPVPETVKRQKAKRAEPEPQPAIITQAPAAVRLIAQLTNSWPGEHLTADLVQLFGESPNEAALTEAVRQWRLANHKLTNYGGIGEWYQEICRDPEWTPGKRFKGNGYKNLRNDPDARESHNRAVLDEVAKEIQSGEWSPW